MSYAHISSEERYVIYHLLLFGLSYREIGRRLNRHHTTISREATRNGRAFGCYWNEPAQKWALKNGQAGSGLASCLMS